MILDPVAAFGAPALGVAAAIAAGGHQVWVVGGAVRNAVLGRPRGDVDLTTDAMPDRVTALAEAAGLKAVPTGIDHGTVTVVADGHGHEVTTLRRDVETDGRHAVVAFSTRIEEDAARRDFTMNALYATPDGTVIDPLGGLPDAQAGLVRFIGDPNARIAEDSLRILRFFRFHAWYADPDHGMDAEGLAACAEGLDLLDHLSRERVGAEMLRLLAAPDPGPALAAMDRCGALIRVLPGAGALMLPVLVHVEQAAGLAPEPLRRLAIIGGQDVAERLRLSRAQARRLDRLQAGMDGAMPPGETGYRFGADAMDVLALQAAVSGREVGAARIATANAGARARFPLSVGDLPGTTGPGLGQELRRLEQLWIDSGFTLTATELRALHERG